MSESPWAQNRAGERESALRTLDQERYVQERSVGVNEFKLININ